MTIKELKGKIDKLSPKYEDCDVVASVNNKRHKVLYAKKKNYPLRDRRFTGDIFAIVCET